MPFLFTAGKGMDERVCELRVRYKPNKLNRIMAATSAKPGGEETRNELVMRVQPDEASVSRFEAGSSARSRSLVARCSLAAGRWSTDTQLLTLSLAACLSLLASRCLQALYMLTTAKEPGIGSEQVRKQVVMDMTYAHQFAGGALLGPKPWSFVSPLCSPLLAIPCACPLLFTGRPEVVSLLFGGIPAAWHLCCLSSPPCCAGRRLRRRRVRARAARRRPRRPLALCLRC